MLSKLRPVLLLALTAIIPVVVLAAVLGQYFLREQQRSLDDFVQERANSTAGVLARELETQIQLLTILSESPRLDPPLEVEAFTVLSERLRARVPLWEMLRVTSPSGEVMLTVPDRQSPEPEIISDRASHDRLRQTGEPVIGNIARGGRGMAAFPVRVPVIRDGSIVYALSAIIRPESLTNLFYANGLPGSWVAWLVDGDGHLVAASNSDASLIGGPASVFATSRISDRPYVSRTREAGDIRVASATVPGSDWSLHIGMPLSAYRQPLDTAFHLLIATSMLTLALGGIAIYLLVRELRARSAQQKALADWQRLDALGKLTGGVAHDFNNLLMSFQSGVESIKRRRDDEQKVSLILDKMLAAVERGKGMTQRLLAFSRRSSHRSRVFRLQDRLENLHQLLSQASRDEVELSIDLPIDLWPVSADPEALEVALINLCINAREAMPRGGKLLVGARNILDVGKISPRLRGEFVAITVTDTGSGIDPSHLNRIFDPFFTTKAKGSSGLGLSQVYGFAAQFGGLVLASSVVGRGSAFTIYLPRAAEPQLEERQRTWQPALSGGRVLIVDDSPEVADAAAMQLEEEGFTTLKAASGSEALSLLAARNDIALVLSDVQMPGMSGLELAPRVQKKHPNVGIVLMTGYSEALEAGEEIGFPVLNKPFDRQELLVKLSLALEQARRRPVANVLPLRRRHD